MTVERHGARDTSRARRTRLAERYGLLLASLVVLFFVQGSAATDAAWFDVLLTALAAGTLLLALRAAEARPAVVAVFAAAGATLVLAVTGLAVAGVAAPQAARIAEMLLIAIAPVVVARGVIRNRREQGPVTIQDVLGVLCVYLLLGMMWAFLYGALDRLGGGPFFADGVAATTSNLPLLQLHHVDHRRLRRPHGAQRDRSYAGGLRSPGRSDIRGSVDDRR